MLASRYAKREIASIIEIGAVGGTCTLGLIASAPQVSALITDTSPQFLRIVQRKLASAGIDSRNVRFATLAGEYLGKLNEAGCDAIMIASALHHVWDWRATLRQAARILRPGGVMVIQEPCREGNLMMGMALDVVLSPLWPAAHTLVQEDLRRIRMCRDSIYYLSNSNIFKEGEDKHSFFSQ